MQSSVCRHSPGLHVSDLFTGSSFLTSSGLYDYSDLLPYIGRSLTSVLEARETMDDAKAWAQVAVQGAALCVLTCVFNYIVTDFLTPTQETVIGRVSSHA